MMQPYLGDVPDGLEPKPKPKPYRPALSYDPIGWPEWIARYVPAVFAIAIVAGILAAIVWFAFRL